MRSEKTTREAMKVTALNMIYDLQEFVKEIDDELNDLVDLSFTVDKLERQFDLRAILDSCDEY